MVLDSMRSKVDPMLLPLALKFKRFNPDFISYLAIVFAAITGVFYYLSLPYFLLGAFIALVLSSLFDALDGRVARLQKISSKRGDLLDHVFDRYADIFIILGITFSTYGNVAIGLAAIIGVMLTSYMGTQSQALGLRRNYSGILGRADRLVFMLVAIILQIIITGSVPVYGIKIDVSTILLLWFAIGGNITALMRFRDAYIALS
ncbi:MAG: CDP-alcohol phosphatidyltransferase family protein [Candidatus Thermoplasmatota archaeon]|nr:CDP-alcohol phosphatidyltransferase family protein [Candidatus Thermoplasmatota archaeon]